MTRTYAMLLALIAVNLLPTAVGDDWPHWMGPKRDNIWRETGVLESFPETGPKVLWRAPVAGGYAGPAVADGLVIVTDYQSGDNVKVDNFQRAEFTGIERVLCLKEATGAVLWKHEYPVKYSISYPAGPRCTPIIHDGKVYTLGAEGHLFCFNADSGAVIWSKDLKQEYKTKSALWGYAAHPLIDGDRLICLVGGAGSHAVAFHKESGQEIWRTLTAPEQGYSPPVIMEVAGVRQLILFKPDGVASVVPESGKVYWEVPYEASNGSVIMTPVRAGNLLYVGGYSDKNMLIELSMDKPGAKVLWQNKPRAALSPVNVQPFLDGQTLYGFDQNGDLLAMELATGKRLWNTPEPVRARRQGSATAFIVRQGDAGDRYWLFTETGDLVIGKLSPEGFTEISRAHVIEPTNFAFGREVVWCMPAFANRRLYVRNDSECLCIDLAK